jgi:gliding motility-associated-like protein
MIVSTAFTPNGDGRNDMLYLVLFRIKESKYFKVFNRWGKVVFETRMLGLGWDGTLQGTMQKSNTFVRMVEGIGEDGSVTRKNGSSTLIR